MRPEVFCRAKWVHDYIAAAWSPRIISDGWCDLVAPRHELGALRDAVRNSVTDGNTEAEFQGRNDKNGVIKAYRSAVAVPGEWLTQPPDPEADTLSISSSAHMVYGCREEMSALHVALKEAVEEAVGEKVEATTWYGPRMSRGGTVLIGHLDAYPEHAIGISVTVESDQPWRMQLMDMSLLGRGDWVEVETSMDSHSALLYEGCRMLHARSIAYAGSAYIAGFFHYRPLSWSAQHIDSTSTAERGRYDKYFNVSQGGDGYDLA